MTRKADKITRKQLFIGLAVVIAIIIPVIFYIITTERVSFVESELLPEGYSPIMFNNEFCASRLGDLAHEIHFLHTQIQEQEKALKKYREPLLEVEKQIEEIEQKEIAEIKEEFDGYFALCNQFDKNPTPELCSQFLEEARYNLELMQENSDASNSKRISEKIEISSSKLRKANRIYNGLQEICG